MLEDHNIQSQRSASRSQDGQSDHGSNEGDNEGESVGREEEVRYVLRHPPYPPVRTVTCENLHYTNMLMLML